MYYTYRMIKDRYVRNCTECLMMQNSTAMSSKLFSPNGLQFCFAAKTHCQRCCRWHPCTTNCGPLRAGCWLLVTGFLGSSNVKSQEHLNLTTKCSLYALKYNTLKLWDLSFCWTILKWSRHILDYTFREKRGTKEPWTSDTGEQGSLNERCTVIMPLTIHSKTRHCSHSSFKMNNSPHLKWNSLEIWWLRPAASKSPCHEVKAVASLAPESQLNHQRKTITTRMMTFLTGKSV